jgi:amino-acid N-acetyltransferase
VTLRGARAADLAAILRLAREGGVLESGIAESRLGFVVAESEGVVVGTCGVELHAGDGLLRTVVVERQSRAHGIGRMLVDEALRRARQHGLRAVYLLTTTSADFFAKLGFEPTGRDGAPLGIRESWEFRAGCPSSAMLMRYDL